MSCGLTARLVAKPRWGKVRRAYSQSLTSDEAIRRAQKAGGFKSVRLIHQDKAGRERGFSGDDSSAWAIGLTSQLLFPAAYNVKAGQWRVRTGDAQYLQEFSHQFDNPGGPGLGWVNHQKSTGEGARAVISSEICTEYAGIEPVGGGGFPMLLNAPWSMEFFLPKPLEDDPCPIWQARWPGSTVNQLKFPGWQFQVIKGQAEICLLAAKTKTAPGWSQAREDELFALLAIENPTSANQEAMDEIYAEIYAVRQSLGFTGDWYDNARRLTFDPEQRGVLNISDGAQTITVRHPEIVKSRKDYPLWNKGQLVFITNGPAFFYRAGFPWFAAKGTLGFGRTKSKPWSGDLPAMQFTVIKDVTGPGTTLTVANHVHEHELEEPEIVVTRSEVRATFTTSHRRYTPRFYAGHYYIPASTRTGGSSTVFDSGDAEFADAGGVGPIIDVIPHFEPGRRQSYTLIARDAQGSTFKNLGFWYDTLEGCVCDLYLDGERVLCDGIILSARLREMASGEYNKTRPEVMHAWTVVEFQIADQNAILDEHLIKEDPVGDFQDLNTFNKKLLNLAGIPSSKINIAAGGRKNPTARPGEDWSTRPSRAVSLGDYIKRHNEKFGMGKPAPWIDKNGIWQPGVRPTVVKSIAGHAAHFSSDPALNSSSTYPGRFAVLAPLDSLRDVTEFFNLFTIEGGEDWDGTPLVATWEITNSITQVANPSSRSLIGREREYYVNDSGLRSLDDVLWVRRSLAQVYGDHPRYFCFKTYYHKGLFPGDLITVDGTLCRIVRIPGGSSRDDRMDIVAREVT